MDGMSHGHDNADSAFDGLASFSSPSPALRCAACGQRHIAASLHGIASDDPSLLARIDDLLYLTAMRNKYVSRVQSRVMQQKCSSEEARKHLFLALIKIQKSNEVMREKCCYYEREILSVQFSIAKTLTNSRTLEEKLCVLKKANSELAEYKSMTLSIREHMGRNLMKTKKMVETFRIATAVDVLQMFNMKTNDSFMTLIHKIATTENERNSESCHLYDCSTILDIPVPNVATFEGVPVDVCKAHMQFAAHAIHCVAHVMNAQLPHPLHLFAAEGGSGSGGNFVSPCNAQTTLLPLSGSRALSLLRANVVVVCIKCGIGVAKLFPPQACVLNLILLREFLKNRLVVDYHSDRDVRLLAAESMFIHSADEHPLRRLYGVNGHERSGISAAEATKDGTNSDWEVLGECM